MLRRRLVALAAAVSLVPLGGAVAPTPGASAGTAAARAHHDRYRATVSVTEHGIPHIEAASFGSLGFGSGYAAAQASAEQALEVAEHRPPRAGGTRAAPARARGRCARGLGRRRAAGA